MSLSFIKKSLTDNKQNSKSLIVLQYSSLLSMGGMYINYGGKIIKVKHIKLSTIFLQVKIIKINLLQTKTKILIN